MAEDKVTVQISDSGLKPWVKKSFRHKAWMTFVYSCLITCGIVILIPLYWTLTTAVKELDQALAFPPIWIPNPVVFRNFADALKSMDFFNQLVNTSVITGIGIIGQLLSCSLAAYGFARFRFPGRDVLFIVALSTMMLPFHILIIPRFVMFKSLGWLDTFLPLIVPGLFAEALYLFLMRQFLMSIPMEMDEASRIDGCSYLQTFYKIILPLAKPALGIIAVFCFLSRWKDFMGPLIYISSQKKYTLALGLNALRHDYFVEWNLLMAATTIVMLPPVIIFFIAQRYFIQGVVVTGIKG